MMFRFYTMTLASSSDLRIPLSTKLVIQSKRKVLNRIWISLMIVTPMKQMGRIRFCLQAYPTAMVK
jgi:hypothetical protein